MSEAEHMNALVEALISMQKRCIDSEVKVEMLQKKLKDCEAIVKQLANSDKRVADLEEQLQIEKQNRKEENWHNRMVIEGLEKTLKRRTEALKKAEERYDEINKVCMDWEERFYEIQEKRSHEDYVVQDEINYLQELVDEYKEAAEFKDRDIHSCEKELSEIKDLNSSYERQIEFLERTVEAYEKELQYRVRGADNWLDSY